MKKEFTIEDWEEKFDRNFGGCMHGNYLCRDCNIKIFIKKIFDQKDAKHKASLEEVIREKDKSMDDFIERIKTIEIEQGVKIINLEIIQTN